MANENYNTACLNGDGLKKVFQLIKDEWIEPNTPKLIEEELTYEEFLEDFDNQPAVYTNIIVRGTIDGLPEGTYSIKVDRTEWREPYEDFFNAVAYYHSSSFIDIYATKIHRRGTESKIFFNWTHITTEAASMKFAGTISCDTIVRSDIEDIISHLGPNEMSWWVLSNSRNETKGGYVKVMSGLAERIHPEDSRGVAVNLGDILLVSKKEDGEAEFKVIPVNDAKAPSDDNSFPGTYGILTPNDRMDLDNTMMQTYSEQNMNNALKSGFYPWCTTGRPEGSEGAYSCVVQRSRQVDNNGFFSVMQTAFARQGTEEGNVYQRVIFYKPSNRSEDNYGKWIKVNGLDMPSLWSDDANNALESGVYGWVTGNVPNSTSAFTIVTKKTTNADGNGFYTVEQTAYQRQNGSDIYKRIMFVKDDGTKDIYGGGNGWFRINSSNKLTSSDIRQIFEDLR